MARLLYRLGTGAARHAWAVILAWLAVLAISLGAVAMSGVQLSNAITIPGTETQRLADRLQEELPEANQGTGRMVFYTEDGSEFTTEQREAIRDAVQAAEDVDEVESVTNPFVVQGRMDNARQQVADGREQLDQAQQAIARVQEQLPANGDLDEVLQERGINREELEQQQEQLEDGERRFHLMGDYRVVSEEGNSAISVVSFTEEQTAVTAETKEAVMDTIRGQDIEGVGVDFSQELAQDISSLLGPGEVVGLIIAAIVLLVMLRAVLPAFLPVVTAVVGVAISTTAALSFSGVIDMMSVTPMLGVMLGLAVGIDYSLFVLNRHRQQLRTGMPVRESIGMAVGTAGTAVFFAALTVIVALVALNVTGVPFLGLMGTVAGLAVVVALLITLTLTPALLSLAGRRVLSRKQRHQPPHEDHIDDRTVPVHLRHPWITTILGVGLLIVMALPVQSMRLGLPDASAEPVDSTEYQTYERIAEDFGAGENGPLVAVVDLPAGLSQQEAEQTLLTVGERIRDQGDVAHVIPGAVTDDRRTGVIQVIPESGPAEAATEELVNDIRGLNADLRDSENVSIGVAGTTAANIDVSQLLGEKLPVYLGVVTLISLLLLLMVFRSLVVPVIATLGFLLSVLAAFGAVVAAYQWGWGGEFLGVHNPGPILSFLPTLMVGILFGLAMDYQLFLGSGMREAYVHGHPAERAVVRGFKSGRTVVTAAAIIMISVFSGFIFSHMATTRPIGFALAVGVLLDAFVVRMFVIPAVMRLLGEKVWWLPRWLDRILPRVDVEGESLVRSADDPVPAHADTRSPTDTAAPAHLAPDLGGSTTAGASAPAATARVAAPWVASEPEPDAPVPVPHPVAAQDVVVAPAAPLPVGDTEGPEVLLRHADPALVATNQALRFLPSPLESEERLLAALRGRGEEAAPPSKMRERVDFERVIVAGRLVLIARPKDQPAGGKAPVVVFWHGGAYVNPMASTHWSYLDALMERTGATVVVPAYGLAPQYSVAHALPLADGLMELARTLGSRVFLAGDSAGGGLALAQAQRMRDAGQQPVTGLVLLAPWVDVTVSNPEVAQYESVDHMLGIDGARAAGRWWAGDRSPRDPVVSPAFGDMAGLPRTLVLQGDRDMLYPDTMDTVARLQRAGVDTTAIVCKGGPHVYALMMWTSRAREDLDDTARWILGDDYRYVRRA